MTDSLDWLAQRVERDPGFLGSVLALYAQSERLDAAGLAAALGCSPEVLPKLKLCRPPRAERFWDDVSGIAAHFGLDADRLAAVVRRGQVLAKLREFSSPNSTLLAARDREKEPEGEGGIPP
jgi:hypothetical protein